MHDHYYKFLLRTNLLSYMKFLVSVGRLYHLDTHIFFNIRFYVTLLETPDCDTHVTISSMIPLCDVAPDAKLWQLMLLLFSYKPFM